MLGMLNAAAEIVIADDPREQDHRASVASGRQSADGTGILNLLRDSVPWVCLCGHHWCAPGSGLSPAYRWNDRNCISLMTRHVGRGVLFVDCERGAVEQLAAVR